MSSYVLVHGSWHGSWCWDSVRRLLERQGHRVAVPDLPGHGLDRIPAEDVTFQACVDRVCTVLDRQEEPVILVGHSFGGAIITQTAEVRRERIETLVYLCAFLLQNGECVRDRIRDTDSLINPNLVLGEDKTTFTVRDEVIQEVFYGDCSDEDVARAKQLLTPEPAGPSSTPVATSRDNFGRVPRVYIECLRDRAIPLEAQREMYTALPCREVISMDTSHSPFFSAPEELVKHLISL